MNRSNRDSVLDFKTVAAILASVPDGFAVIGVWKCMEALAAEDPEGCVRLSPDHPMDASAVARFFRCDPAFLSHCIPLRFLGKQKSPAFSGRRSGINTRSVIFSLYTINLTKTITAPQPHAKEDRLPWQSFRQPFRLLSTLWQSQALFPFALPGVLSSQHLPV